MSITDEKDNYYHACNRAGIPADIGKRDMLTYITKEGLQVLSNLAEQAGISNATLIGLLALAGWNVQANALQIDLAKLFLASRSK